MPRLLLVDDNPSIKRIVVSLLEGTTTEVAYAQTASEALGLLDGDASFDFALLDTTLPEMDGWELLGRMRENPKATNIPIAMMAGVLEDVDHARAENAPMQALLLKPVDFRDLPEKLEGLLAAKPLASTKPSAAPPAAPMLPGHLADPDILVLEEQDLVAEDAPGDLDAPPPAQAADSGSGGDTAFSLSLEELNIGDIEKLATDGGSSVPADEEASMPLPDMEPPGSPNREEASDFIDASPDDLTFDRMDHGASITGAEASAMTEAVGGGDVVQDGVYAAPEKGFEAAGPQPETAEQRQDTAASLEHGEGGAPSPPAPSDVPDGAPDGANLLASSIETELLSDSKFIEAVARAVTRAVAEKLSR